MICCIVGVWSFRLLLKKVPKEEMLSPSQVPPKRTRRRSVAMVGAEPRVLTADAVEAPPRTQGKAASAPAPLKLKGTPKLPDGPAFAASDQQECIRERAARVAALQTYASRVSALRERPELLRSHFGLPEVVISDESRASVVEVEAMLKATSPEQHSFGETLNRRGYRSVGLGPNDSFHVVADDGSTMATVLRGALTMRHAHALQELLRCHLLCSAGWPFGCEADLCPDMERITHGLKCSKSCAGLKVVTDFEVHKIAFRSNDP